MHLGPSCICVMVGKKKTGETDEADNPAVPEREERDRGREELLTDRPDFEVVAMLPIYNSPHLSLCCYGGSVKCADQLEPLKMRIIGPLAEQEA